MSIFNLIKQLFARPVAAIRLTPLQERLVKSRKAVRSLKARANAKRNSAEWLADWMTATFGNISFLIINALFFAIWLLINTNEIPDIKPFDPYPFGMLTTIVSLEAIFLAIFVLISQNREQKINDIREEVDLEIDIIAESEVTKLMEVISLIAKKNGIDLSKDEVLQEMLKPLNREKLEKLFEKEIK